MSAPTIEQSGTVDAEYFVCFGVAEDYEVPKPEEHPGLLFSHLLDANAGTDGSRPWLTWWKSKPDFDRERAPLTAPDEVLLSREGYVRTARARGKPWWRRVRPYNLLVYAVTVVTGLISLHQFWIWLLQPPRVAVEIASESATRAKPLPATFTLALLNHASDVAAKVTLRNLELSPVGEADGAGEPVTVPLGVAKVVEIPKGGETRLRVKGPPLAAGRYAVRIEGTVKAGKFSEQTWPGEQSDSLELRVWSDGPSIEVRGFEPLANPRRAVLSVVLVAGARPDENYLCSVIVEGASGLDVPTSVLRQFQQRPAGVGEVFRLPWLAANLTAFETRSFQFPLESRTEIDWSRLHAQGGCSRVTEEGDSP